MQIGSQHQGQWRGLIAAQPRVAPEGPLHVAGLPQGRNGRDLLLRASRAIPRDHGSEFFRRHAAERLLHGQKRRNGHIRRTGPTALTVKILQGPAVAPAYGGSQAALDFFLNILL